MKKVICVICKTNKNTVLLYEENFDMSKINSSIFSARRIPDNLHYRLVKCNECGLIFSNPIMERVRVENLYRQSRFNYGNESEYLRKTYFNYFKNELYLKNKNIRILEIGCGNGFFLEELFKQGFRNAYGIEPGKESVLKADKNIKKRIRVDVLKKGLYEHGFFDVICCFHTLDHIIDLENFIIEIKSLLNKNGQIFFVVHDTNGLSVKLLGERSPIFDVEHIFLFNKKSINKFLKKNGFSNPRVFSILNTYPLFYWLKIFPIPLKLKTRLMKIFELSKLGYIPFSLRVGNIGIVASKP